MIKNVGDTETKESTAESVLVNRLETFWVGLQADHDLEAAQCAVGKKIEKEVTALA